MTTMREQFGRTANALLAEDPRTALILAEISLGLFENALAADPRRVVNLGIMEQGLVGVAAGFALEGFRPIAHTIAPFLTERALEQIKLDLGYQRLAATLVSNGASYDYATEGATHHGAGDVQALLSIPGVEIAIPGAAAEVDVLLRHAHLQEAVSYLRTSDQSNLRGRSIVPGRVLPVREGTRGTVVAVGPLLDTTLEAVADIDVAVVYATTIAPFDGEGLRAALAPDGPVIAVEPMYSGSLAFTLVEALGADVRRIVEIGVPRRVLAAYGERADLDALAGLDVAGVRRQVLAALQ